MQRLWRWLYSMIMMRMMMTNHLIDVLDWELPWEIRRASMFSFFISLFWNIFPKFDNVYLDKNMHKSNFFIITYESWLLYRNSGRHLSNVVPPKKNLPTQSCFCVVALTWLWINHVIIVAHFITRFS